MSKSAIMIISYSIGRIIDSMNCISSSVSPYFLYSSSSVQGFEKSWRGTKAKTALETFTALMDCIIKNLTNFVCKYPNRFSAGVVFSNGPITKYEWVQTSFGKRTRIVVVSTLNIPSLPGSPACSAPILLTITLYLSIVSKPLVTSFLSIEVKVRSSALPYAICLRPHYI